MSIIAKNKFRVQSVKLSGEGEHVHMVAEWDGGISRDFVFCKALQQASLDFLVTNKRLFGKFQPGMCFHMNLTPVNDGKGLGR